jgi:hypothetical protein
MEGYTGGIKWLSLENTITIQMVIALTKMNHIDLLETESKDIGKNIMVKY